MKILEIDGYVSVFSASEKIFADDELKKAKNEKLNITPHLISPKSHCQVYMYNGKGESVLVRVDNFMRKFI